MSTSTTTSEPARERSTFTGLRRRKTRRSVVVVDRIAHWLISVGGVGVTIALATMIVFLSAVVVPLFRGADPVDKLEAQTFQEAGEKPFFEKVKDLFG